MLSKHAKIRMQQRGLPLAAIEIVLDIGRFEYVGNGAELVYLDRFGRQVAKSIFRAKGIGDCCLDAYLIRNSDGTVVTIGHRYTAIKRH